MRGYETHSDPAYESKYSAFRANSAPARPAASITLRDSRRKRRWLPHADGWSGPGSAPGTGGLEAGPAPGSHWVKPGNGLWGCGVPCVQSCRWQARGCVHPFGVPVTACRGGMGRVRVRAAGSIRPVGPPPVAGAVNQRSRTARVPEYGERRPCGRGAVGPAVREVSAPVFRVRIIGVALGQVPPGEERSHRTPTPWARHLSHRNGRTQNPGRPPPCPRLNGRSLADAVGGNRDTSSTCGLSGRVARPG